MALNIAKEVSAMERMTVGELQERYAEVFGERPRGHNKPWLVKRIAWRLQANAEGDLSERARRRAMELADDADLRLTAPHTVTTPIAPPADPRLPMPNTILARRYRGRTIQVLVLPKGFEYEGQVYKSLSAVARAVTGTHWNGYHFFGLRKPEAAR